MKTNRKIKMSKREKALTMFMERMGVQNLSMISDEDGNSESHFSLRGCEVCSRGLGNEVFECNGYDPKEKCVVGEMYVCIDCLALEANGYDCDFQREEDDRAFTKNNPDFKDEE